MWLALTILTIAADPHAGANAVQRAQHNTPARLVSIQRGDRNYASPRLAASANFVVRSQVDQPRADRVLEVCDTLCAELQEKWLGQSPAEPWRPRCEIVLHATRESYLREVGAGGAQTRGCCLIQFDGDRIVTRRIDLLADNPDRALSALAHELTHVILADRFGNRPLPRWADEGIATLSDAANKQALHRRDLLAAVRGRGHMRVIDLLSVDGYPPRHQLAVFYGQSLSLVEYLAQLDDPARLVDFVEQAGELGYDRALQQVYDINNVAELERLWYEQLAASD
jgi:hypothetical protein